MVVMAEAAGHFEIGVDIGGTFTDVVCRDGTGAMRLVKIPTTRRNPSAGVKAAMDYMQREWRVSPDEIVRFVHGTTVATNAVIEAKGAKIGLLTTVGFKDVLEIGRQMRHKVYDLVLKPEAPAFLAPGALRKEVRERVTATGNVLVALDESSVRQAVDELVAEGVEAIAVSYLFSFLNPAHERRTREIIAERHPQIMVSLSSDVDPAFREYERTCVTAFDAYIKPVVGRSLENMEQDLAEDGG
jgi:N-methylhydantoinase A/oxoprolinase/acetone carboxylase beta subunit